MILRIVRGMVPSEGLAALAQRSVASYGPVAEGTPGLVRFHVAVRPVSEGHVVVAISCWASVEDAIAAYGGDLDRPRPLAGLDGLVEVTGVAYFEVDERLLRRATGNPAVLRVSVASVAQGADASIQQQLRTRLDDLPDDMTEAYVGRRIAGADVEIAFVSAWDRVPASPDLEAPIWPDVVDRLESLVVELFVPILSGSSVAAG